MSGSIPATSMAVREGNGYTVDRDGLLTSTLVNRKLAVMTGIACLALFGWIFYLDWHKAIHQDQWFYGLIDYVALICLGVGLISIGLRKQVKLSSKSSQVWQEAGWFGLSTSTYETSAWPLDRFDRVLVFRTNLLGLEAPTRGNPHRGGAGIRFQVRLAGNSEVTVNSYRNYNHASQLANVLADLTGYPVRSVQ